MLPVRINIHIIILKGTVGLGSHIHLIIYLTYLFIPEVGLE